MRQLEEALRRLANGDAAQLLSVNFPEQLNGLRFQFNRLASTLQVNLLPTSRAVLDLRENAYGAQKVSSCCPLAWTRCIATPKAWAMPSTC